MWKVLQAAAIGLMMITAATPAQKPPKAEDVLKEAKLRAAEKNKAIYLIFGASWCEALRGAIRIDLLRRAVDPAEAERFVDRVVVRNSRLAGLLAVVHEPDLASGLVVLAQPRPPVGDAVDVQSARDLRHAIMNHTVVARASSTSDAIARPRRPTARARKSVPGTSIATLDRIPSGIP